MNKLKGTGVALATPFTTGKEVDWKGLEKLIGHVISNGKGVEYLVSLGTTGESATLSKDEKNKVLDFTIEKADGRVPIVAGFGGNNTQAIINDIEQRDFSGISAILSVSPYYNKPTQEGISQHYKAISESTEVPIILYNVPGRTSSNITAATTLRLAHDFDNIIGIKEASGDLEQCMQIVKNKPDGFLVISGEDPLTLPMISFGMDGVISVVANAFPREYSEMVRQALAGNFETARELHYKVLDVIGLLFAEGNPGGVKCALEILGVCGSNLRLPLAPVSDETRQKLEDAIQNVKGN